MKRRSFLKDTTIATAGLTAMLNGFSLKAFSQKSPWIDSLYKQAAANDNVLILIQLGGGNDGLNTVIPLDQYENLFNARQNVIIPENQLLALQNNDTVALHPALAKMQTLYNENKVQIIQSVGYPNPKYSHFRSTDIWLSGSASNEVIPTGWAARFLQYEYPNFPIGYPNDTMQHPLAIEISYSLSMVFQGVGSNLAFSVGDPSYFYEFISGAETPAPNTPAGEQLKYVRLIANQSQAYSTKILEAYEASANINQVGYNENNELAQQLKIIARLLAGGSQTRIFLVHHSGFDTHANQVLEDDHTKGQHNRLLRTLSEAIYDFQKDLEAQNLDDKVLTLTFSEFGRRIIANDSQGTDHGAAAPMFIIGKNVQGGILGNNPLIPQNATEDDNLPMQYDFRSVYASILKDWFCVPENDLSNITLYNLQTLPIVNNPNCNVGIHEANQQAGKNILQINPNPLTHIANIYFETLQSHPTILQIFNPMGQLVATPISTLLPIGKHQTYWNSENLPTGTYYCRIQNGTIQQVKMVVKVQ